MSPWMPSRSVTSRCHLVGMTDHGTSDVKLCLRQVVLRAAHRALPEGRHAGRLGEASDVVAVVWRVIGHLARARVLLPEVLDDPVVKSVASRVQLLLGGSVSGRELVQLLQCSISTRSLLVRH